MRRILNLALRQSAAKGVIQSSSSSSFQQQRQLLLFHQSRGLNNSSGGGSNRSNQAAANSGTGRGKRGNSPPLTPSGNRSSDAANQYGTSKSTNNKRSSRSSNNNNNNNNSGSKSSIGSGNMSSGSSGLRSGLRSGKSATKSTTPTNDSVKQDKGKHKFTLNLGNNQEARIDYRSIGRNGDTLDLYHSEVPFEMRNRGIGKALARGALEQLARSQVKVRLTCSYLRNYLDNFAPPEVKKSLKIDHSSSSN